MGAATAQSARRDNPRMSRLALNLLLAIAWMLLLPALSFGQLVVGFVIGFVAIALAERALGSRRYARSAAGAALLAAAFTRELSLASLTLTRDILRRRRTFHPAFIRLEAPGLTDVQMVLLANLISLTPGTMTVDADREQRALFVHALYARDPAELRGRLRVFVDLIRRATGRDAPAREA